MSASYNELLPTPLDRARSLLGDTEVEPAEDALHSDEHIAAVLNGEASFEAAVAYLAEELITRFALEPVKLSAKGASADFSERIPSWRELASRMRAEVAAVEAAALAAQRPRGTTSVRTEVCW